jgi:hypothetical protein
VGSQAGAPRRKGRIGLILEPGRAVIPAATVLRSDTGESAFTVGEQAGNGQRDVTVNVVWIRPVGE